MHIDYNSKWNRDAQCTAGRVMTIVLFVACIVAFFILKAMIK